MRCPYCGAETQNKICEFCGSEIPQENANINITNNYYGNMTQQSSKTETFVGKCPNCGITKINFKREIIGTATQSTSHKNTIGSGRKGQAISQAAYRTVGLCQNCGYTWNPNVNSTNVEKKGSPTWLWVLGWICIFPLPLSILLLKKKDMKPALKYGIIVVAWIIYLFIGLFGDSKNTNNTTSKQTENVQIEQSMNETQEKTVESTESKTSEVVNDTNSYIADIVEQYNLQATEKLVFVDNFK